MQIELLRNIVFSTLLIFLLAFPSAFGGFVGIYLYSIVVLVIFCIIFTTLRIKIHSNILYFILLVFFCSIISAYFSMLLTSNIWFLREFIRLAFLIVFVFTIRGTVTEEKMFTLLPFFLSCLLIIDWLMFKVYIDVPVSKWVMSQIAMRGMQDYIVDYWRHIGIGGNPNFSAFIYCIAIIFNLAYLKRQKIRFKIKDIFIIVTSFLSFYLLFITYSRTALLALLVSLFISNFRVKHVMYYIPLLVLISLLFLIDIEFVSRLKNRFSSFSAVTHRLEIWQELMSYVDVRTLLLGKELYVPVVDNDYLYFLYRYGLVSGGLLLIIPWIIFAKCTSTKRRDLLFPLLLFYYISALAGGPLAHPKTYILLLFILALGQKKDMDIINVQKNSRCSFT